LQYSAQHIRPFRSIRERHFAQHWRYSPSSLAACAAPHSNNREREPEDQKRIRASFLYCAYFAVHEGDPQIAHIDKPAHLFRPIQDE